jgi:MFS transporter, FSR family, fosmidomycin resistance protein
MSSVLIEYGRHPMQRTQPYLPRRASLTGMRLASLLAVAHVAVDAVASMPGALLPTLKARFVLSETELAVLVAVLATSSSLLQPLFGTLADRWGMRLVGGLGAIVAAGVLSLVGVAPSIAVLVVLFLIGGLGSAAFHPAGASIARAAQPDDQGLGISLFSAGGTLGVALGPIIVVAVIATAGVTAMSWLMLPGVLLGLLLLWLVPAQQHQAHPPTDLSTLLHVVRGPVGVLALAGVLNALVFTTFNNAMPLWLVAEGVAVDDALIGWTLATFALGASAGSIVASLFARRVARAVLVGGTMLLALLPLFAIFTLTPGTPLFLLTVLLAGALVHASVPLLVVSAQDLAPHAVATASGILMGFTIGVAGILYIGVGYLQERLGIAPALQVAFFALIPAALLAVAVLVRHRLAGVQTTPTMTVSDLCRCTVCRCAGCRTTSGAGA